MSRELETVIAIPPLPFRKGELDQEAHRRNVRYLIDRNFLNGDRKRAIGIAGTSLIHHLDPDSLIGILEVTGEAASGGAVVIAGLVATPRRSARRFVERAMRLSHPPDYFLLMPIPGVCNPEGIANEFELIARECGERSGARFLLYMRSSDLIAAYAALLTRSPHIDGVKIGTREQDVAMMKSAVPADKQVLWGVGDRATGAARLGSRGHTSGITLICARACDEIHNAYSSGDFAAAERVERLIADFEEIRFMEGRAYNYSAVVAAATLGGFDDVDLGEGGPFNAAPPEGIMARLRACVEGLKEYH